MYYYTGILRTGHRGVGQFGELRCYIYGNGMREAEQAARRLPMVKHLNKLAIINMKMIPEEDFVKGVVQDWYGKLNYADCQVETIERIVNKFQHLENAQLQTEIGKQLMGFYTKYKSSQTKAEKEELEIAFSKWVKNIIKDDNFGF